jgi:hypothetical protein
MNAILLLSTLLCFSVLWLKAIFAQSNSEVWWASLRTQRIRFCVPKGST